MAGTFIATRVGDVSYIVDNATETLKTLINPSVMTTTGISLEDNAVDYQVPTGKTFEAVGMLIQTNAAAKTLTLFSSTAADGVVGEVDLAIIGLPAQTNPTEFWVALPNKPTWAVDLFVNVKTSNATNSATFLAVIGVEV